MDIIREQVPLAPLTTFGVGGPARYFTEARNEEELREAVRFAYAKGVPFFILGGGSNILVSDSGFPGLVVKISSRGIEPEEKGGDVLITARAGEKWDDLVKYTVERGWYGLENLSGIPGTVGAAPIQNIGAYGAELKDSVLNVAAYDTESDREKIFSGEECQFAYRDSIFKKDGGRRYVVLSATFRLRKEAPLDLSYRDLAEHFKASGRPKKTATLSDLRTAVLAIRARKFPLSEELGTAGSFFKNPIVAEAEIEKLRADFPDMPVYHSSGPGIVKIPAAFLIDKVCGLKGYVRGRARSFEKNALALVIEEGGSAGEVRELSLEIAGKVLAVTGIKLFPEVELVGEF